MKVKLDENLPVAARGVVEQFGYDVDTVVGEGLGGATDASVLEAARRAGRFMITLDRGFGDVRRYPPGTHTGIAVLRVDSHHPAAVAEALEGLMEHHDLGDLVVRRVCGLAGRSTRTLVGHDHEARAALRARRGGAGIP